jgi:UDP-2-acetamido-2,6-beta-L-arabino-hexul-4-ose reductase
VQIVVTGANGFIGQNLCVHLSELALGDVTPITRKTSPEALRRSLASADVVVHLAGVNRPTDVRDFTSGNADLTASLCTDLLATRRAVPVVYASSIQAAGDTPYGRSKLAAEDALLRYGSASGAGVALLRLANVFGKWCRPNYNSVVATFCHNIARGLPITVSDPSTMLTLVYVDDVVRTIIALLRNGVTGRGQVSIEPTYDVTLGFVAETIQQCAMNRSTLLLPRVGTGVVRALYATYVSYLPAEDFAYDLASHEDPRGVFAELLRTSDSGQVSFFTARPGVTRGGHYHHTKTEKFLVVKGSARFGFRHVVTGERRDLTVHGVDVRVVETVPGWIHDVTNIGDGDLFVLLWANEVFDRERPDTIAAKVVE